MSAWTYLYLNHYPLRWNVRRTSSIVFAERERGPEYEPDPDDMENLKKPSWWDDGYEPPARDGEESDRQRPAQERDYYQEDYERYMEERERERHNEPQYADRYGWDQYA